MRRGFWLGVGFGLGIAATRRAHRTVTQLSGSATADRLRRTFEATIADGRRDVASREATLRSVLAPPANGTHTPQK